MERIEKTIFISYRRKDISWALAVYQFLAQYKYDVFLDYTSISSGDFEQIIVSNIKARAHFILILTPEALDRCSEPGDWLRREVETAIDERRNIVPLFFDEFSFSSPSVVEKLTGKLSLLPRYNGLEVPSGYFPEAMERLRRQYLNVPLDAVLHPIPRKVRKVVRGEQRAVSDALAQKKDELNKLIKPVDGNLEIPDQREDREEPMLKNLFQPFSSWYERQSSGVQAAAITAILGLLGVVIAGCFQLAAAVISRPASPTLITSTSTLMSQPISMPTSETPSFLAVTITASTETPTSLITPSDTPTVTVTITSTSTPTMSQTATLTLTPISGIGSTMISPNDGMTLLYVPAGEFTMGSNSGGPDERPVHSPVLDAFWIDQTEVTNSMYAKCVGDGACNPPTRLTFFNDPAYADHPAVYVFWNQAKAYCSWVGRRLPTEAEWEKAARGTEGLIYPWGGESPSSKFLDFPLPRNGTTEVGQFPQGASPYGALDMAGNSAEWVSDWYGETYYQLSPASNPEGPGSGQTRSFRGGSWIDGRVRPSAFRRFADPSYTSNFIGFRCARDD